MTGYLVCAVLCAIWWELRCLRYGGNPVVHYVKRRMWLRRRRSEEYV